MSRIASLVFLSVTLLAASLHAETEPKVVDYIDLKLNFESLLHKAVRVSGGFYYLDEGGNSFQLRVGVGMVIVDISGLPPETVAEVRQLRNFSEVPVSVTGIFNRGGVQRDQPLIQAQKLEIEDASTTNTYYSRKGIVTVPELRINPFRFLGSSVTMQGRFDFLQPGHNSFRLWRGIDEVEVNYGKLSPEEQREVLNVKNFSDQGMKVTGVLRESPSPEVAFILDATAVQLDPVVDAAQQAAQDAQKKGPEITYADILQHPQKYLKRSQVMKGGFECCDPRRKVMQIWQGGDSIEVIYRDIPQDQIDEIESQRPFNSIVMVVTGIVRAYPKAPNRYLMEAHSVVLDKGS